MVQLVFKMNMIRKKLLEGRKIRVVEVGNVICKENEKFSVCILLNGRLRVGDYYKNMVCY